MAHSTQSGRKLTTGAAMAMALALAGSWGVAYAQVRAPLMQPLPAECGGNLDNGYGPFDYRPDFHKPIDIYDHTPHSARIQIVHSNHFTPEVELLIKGLTSDTAGTDLDYTLRVFPNHHRALLAMMRLGEKERSLKPKGARYSVDCWFLRALSFRNNDPIVRMIYSTYLNKQGRANDANGQLAMASEMAKENGFTHFNIGLHYLELKNYDKAVEQAHLAQKLGFPRTELRDQLQSLGKWVEPPSGEASAPAAAAGSASAAAGASK